MNEKSIRLEEDGCVIFENIIKPELYEKLKAGYYKYWDEIKIDPSSEKIHETNKIVNTCLKKSLFLSQ